MSYIIPKPVNFLLYSFGLAGSLALWGRAAVDGTLEHLLGALHGSEPYKLPGTQNLLRTRFTGIWPLDYLLDVLVIFFWEVADGSHPDASAIGLYFLGQYVAVLSTFYLEYSRKGAGSSFSRPATWLTIFQMTGIGCAGPIWALMYLRQSPTVAPCSPQSLQHASSVAPDTPPVIILGLLFGYLLPAAAMAIPAPTRLTYDSKQVALVLWNIFPLLVFAFQASLNAVIPKKVTVTESSKTRGKPEAKQHLASTRWMYATAFVFSFASHISILAVSISTVWLPMLWQESYIADLSPVRLFIPPLSLTVGQTVGDGVQSFMMWDQVFGYGTVSIVMLLQLQNASRSTGKSFSWFKSVGAVLLGSAIVGPGNACLIISWLRDEMLFGSA
ncbi:hypothetical protein F4806DRAFT_499762 [Annulohypoxylon nitens]|nr:hypothetical protein F4806DRAFT_499762 [Annulohypoxylon nitens]